MIASPSAFQKRINIDLATNLIPIYTDFNFLAGDTLRYQYILDLGSHLVCVCGSGRNGWVTTHQSHAVSTERLIAGVVPFLPDSLFRPYLCALVVQYQKVGCHCLSFVWSSMIGIYYSLGVNQDLFVVCLCLWLKSGRSVQFGQSNLVHTAALNCFITSVCAAPNDPEAYWVVEPTP